MLTVPIDKNPYDDRRQLFTFKELNLDYGVTVLVGCNGCGKSTLLGAIARTLKKQRIEYVLHDSRQECSDGMSKMLFYGQIDSIATYRSASEGERIDQLLNGVVGLMGKRIHVEKAQEDLAFMFDGVDSGLSIDKIVEIKEVLHECVLREHPNTYIVFSANAYELARDEKCIYARTGKEVSFKDYEEYRKFILKTKADKDRRFA